MIDDAPPKDLRELVERYIASRENVVAHPASLRAHTRLIVEKWGHLTLDELMQKGVVREIARKYPLMRPEVTQATTRKQLSILQSAFRHAWRREWIDGLPAMTLPPASAPEKRAFTSEDREILLAAADAYPTELHLRAFVYLAVYTKQPSGKIVEMTWDQVDFDRGLVWFIGRDRKRQQTPMDEKLRNVLNKAHDAAHTNNVIEFRAKPVKNIYAGFRALTKRAGLAIDTIDLRLGEGGGPQDANKFEEGAPYVFVSYCHEDGRVQANALVVELEKKGQKCFIAPRDMKAGDFAGQLTRNIKGADALVLMLTPDANESRHVLQEVHKAFVSKKSIVPVVVNNTTPGEDLEHYLGTAHSLKWTTAVATAAAVLKACAVPA